MISQKNKLLNSLISGAITNEEFIRQYSIDANIDDEYCLRLFEEGFDTESSEIIEEGIIVGTTVDCFSNKFSNIFCKLLQEDWHFKHEDIARILQDLRDSSTVDCLFNAAQLHFEYLDYDDTYQFARKCIKALSAIDNDAAINKLQLLAQSNTPEIRKYAAKELNYKGLL